MTQRLSGAATPPSAHGHRPDSTRTSTDLPVLDSPLTWTVSPRSTLRLAVDAIAGRHDVHHALAGGVPLGDPVVVVHHPGDGNLHLDEGGGQLRDLAQRQVAGEILR